MGFRNLQNKCLAEVDNENKIKMHDHLRDMGRNIAKEVSMPRRLWGPIKNHHELLEQSSSSFAITEVRGIRMPPDQFTLGCDEGSEMPSDEIFRIRNLQLLETEGNFVKGILSRVQTPNLIWLRWNDCPDSSLPSWIQMDHLRVLEVFGTNLRSLWQSESKALLELRELTIYSPLLEFPQSFGQLKYLEKIVAEGAEVATLPEEFCPLRLLKYLNLTSCLKLQTLPNSFGNLTNLRFIDLSKCKSLKMLPDSFGDLRNLENIDMNSSTSLEMLPDSFGNLTKLEHISISSCIRLKTLPNSFGYLTKLKGKLDLSECKSLKRLPNIMKLNNLEYLKVRNCPLSELPFKRIEGEREIIPLTESTRGQRPQSELASSVYEGMFQLKKLEKLELYKTKIKEVFF